MNIIITITITALVVLYAGLFKAKKFLLPLTILGLLGSLAFVATSWNNPTTYYGMMRVDNFGLAFTALILVASILIFILSVDYFAKDSQNIAEYYTLMLFSIAGMYIMLTFQNMAMLFIGVEIMSVSLYILAGIRKLNFASNEASLKYFLMGAFSTGFLLLGITFLYGATGSFDLSEIQAYLLNQVQDVSPLFYVGIILLMIGMSFKIGAAPFHFWTPDVYEGSPSLITTFMSTVVKTAGIAAFVRLFAGALEPLHAFWSPALLVLVVITLCIGNITALYQHNFKRMLAYSSISHAGYLLFALVEITANSSNAVLMYGAAYSFASIAAFGVLILVKQNTGSEQIEAFQGLGKRNPFMAVVLTIAMLSLAGIPLTAGFIGKYMMFLNVMENYHTTLVVIAILNALIGFYYYFKVIIAVWFKEGDFVEVKVSRAYQVIFVVSALITLILGVYPSVILNLI